MTKPFASTPMHVSVTENPISKTPYPIALGHTLPDGSMSPLTLYMTVEQLTDLQSKIGPALEEVAQRLEEEA